MIARKQNCWEFNNCGRDKSYACTVPGKTTADGVNGGINGGRICWAVGGTFCDGKAMGTYAEKVLRCSACEFRLKVQEEEGYGFRRTYF